MGTQARGHGIGQLASDVAGFVADLTFGDVPDDGIRLAERCFVDTVGVALAGSDSQAGAGAAAALECDGDARLLGRDGTADAAGAAFVNGTAGHALDFDDVSDAVSGHPSVPIVPAVLAVGEAEGASGRDLLTAFVAGFETTAAIAAPVIPDHYEAGWHATSTLGSFGAAAAVANLLGLDEAETRHALNVAASTPAGLKRNFGTPTKPMHAGQAARSGVTAALLAREGFTADRAAIDGDRGFYDLYGGGEPDSDAVYRPGDRWAIVEDGVGVKKYPCCYFTHSSIEAAARLAEEADLAPDDVASVHVRAARGADDALHHDDPGTGLEGKFSMHYTVASAIARDRVGLATFEDGNVDDPGVQAVREVLSFEVDTDLPYGSYEATVTIETTDGEVHELTLEGPPGTHEDPLPDAELEEKFLMCATEVLDRGTAERAYRRLDALREQAGAAAALEEL